MLEISWLSGKLDSIIHIIQSINWVDVLDILAVSVVLYFAYKFIRNKRAGKLFGGVLILLFGLLVGEVAGMHALQFIFKNFFHCNVLISPLCKIKSLKIL